MKLSGVGVHIDASTASAGHVGRSERTVFDRFRRFSTILRRDLFSVWAPWLMAVFLNEKDGQEMLVTFGQPARVEFQDGTFWEPTVDGKQLRYRMKIATLSYDCIEYNGEIWRRLDPQREFESAEAAEELDEATEEESPVPLEYSCVEGATIPQLQAGSFQELFQKLGSSSQTSLEAYSHPSMPVPELLERNLGRCKQWWSAPNDLQKFVLAAGFAGRDVHCIAPCGSGQVFASLLAVLSQTLKLPAPRVDLPGCYPDTVLLCHTRELALQYQALAKVLLEGSPMRSVCLGARVKQEIAQIARGAEVLVTTPTPRP